MRIYGLIKLVDPEYFYNTALMLITDNLVMYIALLLICIVQEYFLSYIQESYYVQDYIKPDLVQCIVSSCWIEIQTTSTQFRLLN